MPTTQRLIVCLDGTWNNRDDSTNVLHHFNLVKEGVVPDATERPVLQKKYYHPGVGTGVLDGITGGGFGFGLEENVRDAYNWLVQQYQDTSDPRDADEIYVFGFSRGAYTARSLVGFISRCGLLKRGAPLTVSQLWGDYCILGREREERSSIWDTVFGAEPAHIRPINELVRDPWSRREMPAQMLTEGEKLLVRFSRRVRITYLGIYDTVGALGWDALAIPGLKSKLAMHHNMRPTTLIQSCRHALAMDEHRPGFSHTPFLQYIGHEGVPAADVEAAAETEMAEEPTDAAVVKRSTSMWDRNTAMWRRKIEQRWFVGAHSNVGGGYPDNELAQVPLRWVFEGAQVAVKHRGMANGLVCEPLSVVPPVSALPIRDSYEEFARPFWTMILRGKRYYRPIDPPADYQASRKPPSDLARPAAGFSLKSINEQVDPSVFAYWENARGGTPPNLVEYAERKVIGKAAPEILDGLGKIKREHAKHLWLGVAKIGYVALVLWATFAGIGLAALNKLVGAGAISPFPIWVLTIVAFSFVLVDWAESRVNFALALQRSSPCARAFLDAIYWGRFLGFVLFAAGALAAFVALWSVGWNAARHADRWAIAGQLIGHWWPVPLGAAFGLAIANLFDGGPAERWTCVLIAFFTGPIATFMMVPLVMLLAEFLARISAPAFGPAKPAVDLIPPAAHFAGLLLLLQIGVIYFLNAYAWASEPLNRVKLGAMTKLQLCATPAAVTRCLERWRQMLVRRWDPDDGEPAHGPAAQAMQEIVREALWRDMFGFIPVYTLVLGFGLWFGYEPLGLKITAFGLPLWQLLPAITAIADYGEDLFLLRYLSLHAEAKTPSWLMTLTSFVLTLIKTIAFTIAGVFTLAAIVSGSWQIALGEKITGWRGAVALSISGLTALALAIIFLSAVIYRVVMAGKKRPSEQYS